MEAFSVECNGNSICDHGKILKFYSWNRLCGTLIPGLSVISGLSLRSTQYLAMFPYNQGTTEEMTRNPPRTETSSHPRRVEVLNNKKVIVVIPVPRGRSDVF